jgi:transposase
MRRCRDFRRGMRRRVSGLAWRRRSFGSGEFARAAGAQAGSAAPLEARSASGLSAGAGCTDARPDDQRAAPRCRAGCACEPATQWTFLDRCGLAFKKDRPCERAGSAGHPEAAAGLVRSSAGCRSAPSRLHRRDLAFHDHGSSPWLKSVRSSRPNSPPGDIVVLDNLGSHKGAGVRPSRRPVATLFYLPPYSPNFNPIENAFSKLKAPLRKPADRTRDTLWHRIGAIIPAVEPAERANLSRTSGYDPG